jgi:hypothetical protein
VSSLSYYSCNDDANPAKEDTTPITQEEKIAQFEREFIKNYYDTIPSGDGVIKLVGYKTIYTGEEKDEFKDFLKSHRDELNPSKHNYYAEDGSFIRVYFPLSDAIIDYNEQSYEADENGIVSVGYKKSNKSTEDNYINLVGRKRSENVVGTEANIIVGNRIILEKEIKRTASYNENGAYVFDLEEKAMCGHEDHNTSKKTNAHKVSCVDNHIKDGIKRNCSTAFGIYKGKKCAFQSDVCMDYNGIFSNCKNNGSIINFLGSDCSYALAKGHCWNELL